MYSTYDYLTVINTKNNKWKKPFLMLIIVAAILIIGASGFGVYEYIQYRNEIRIEERIAKEKEEAEEQERLRIEEEQRKERERLKNSQPLNEEQIQKVEGIYSGEEKNAYLTFDDGPTTTVTPLILDLLKQEDIKATFFVLGGNARSNADLIKREFEEGHYIANHGYTHKYSAIYTNIQTVLDEYNLAESCIQEALGNPDYHSRVFRFPGGSVGGYYKNIKSQAKAFLRENSIASLDWNALTNDADGAHTKEKIMETLELTVGEKQSVVILMHDAYDKILTYETLPDVINFLRERGYNFKNLYDIL